MKVLFVETMFSKLNFETEIDALPRNGDIIEMDGQVFIVDKVVFRLGAKREIVIFINFR